MKAHLPVKLCVKVRFKFSGLTAIKFGNYFTLINS